MSIRIFDTDPEAAPRSKFADVVGRFRSGTSLNGRPVSLSTWRVTTGDPEVSDTVAEMLGGQPGEWDAHGEDRIEVITEADEVLIRLKANGIKSGMALWGRTGKPIRKCDGVTQADGSPCACPSKLADRKEAAKAGTGCEPNIVLHFRLADAPDLGMFKFTSSSWTLVDEVNKAEAKLAALLSEDDDDAEVLAVLGKEHVEYDTKAGRHVEFTKPTLKVLSLAPDSDAEAEEPF
jgi:hypothetical protein